MRRLLSITTLCALCFAQTACDDDLKTVAKTLNVIAAQVLVVQDIVIAAEENDLISEDDARVVITITARIGRAGREAVALTKSLAELNESDRHNLLVVLTPITETVDRLLDDETLSLIEDASTREKIEAAFIALKATIVTAQLILGVE